MNDLFGVGEVKGMTELCGDVDGFFGGEAVALDEDLSEAAALKEFHDVVVAKFGFLSKVVVYADDMFVLLREQGGDLDLLLKAFDLVGLCRFEWNDFDDTLSLSFEVDMFGEVNRPCTAFAKLAHQSVLSRDGFERKATIEAKRKFCVGVAREGVVTPWAAFREDGAGRCQDRLSWCGCLAAL